MKTRVYLTVLIKLLATLSSQAQQDTVYAARINDSFLLCMEKATVSLSQNHSMKPEVLEAIASSKARYVIEKDGIFKNAHDSAKRQSALANVQREVVQRLASLLSTEQMKYYLQEYQRLGRLHGMVWAASSRLQARNAANLAYRETETMRQRYGLSGEQAARVHTINRVFYEQLTSLIERRNGRESYQTDIKKLEDARQQQLNDLFGMDKYNAYKQDMEAMEAQVRRDTETENAAWEQIKNQKP